jgi:hypothetical protein
MALQDAATVALRRGRLQSCHFPSTLISPQGEQMDVSWDISASRRTEAAAQLVVLRTTAKIAEVCVCDMVRDSSPVLRDPWIETAS